MPLRLVSFRLPCWFRLGEVSWSRALRKWARGRRGGGAVSVCTRLQWLCSLWRCPDTVCSDASSVLLLQGRADAAAQNGSELDLRTPQWRPVTKQTQNNSSQNHSLTRAPSQGSALELGDSFQPWLLYSGHSFRCREGTASPQAPSYFRRVVCVMDGGSEGRSGGVSLVWLGWGGEKGSLRRFPSPSPSL